MKKSISIALILFSTCVIASGTAPEISQERNEATGFALTLDLTTNNLVKMCSGLNGKYQNETNVIRDEWNKNNRVIVTSAHNYLLYVKAMISNSKGEAIANQFYQSQTNEFVKQAKLSILDVFPNGVPDEEKCNSFIQTSKAGKWDISTKKEYYLILQGVKKDMDKIFEK